MYSGFIRDSVDFRRTRRGHWVGGLIPSWTSQDDDDYYSGSRQDSLVSTLVRVSLLLVTIVLWLDNASIGPRHWAEYPPCPA